VTVLEKAVEEVQLTVVWPADWLCTSMEEAAMVATLPTADPGGVVGVVAAPALVASVARTASPVTTAPIPSPVRLHVMFLMGCCLSIFIYSLLNASIGARWAARLAG
jgi:hypothetical protein